MLVAIEYRDSRICKTISRNQLEPGFAFLPAVAVRFLLQPRELQLQYQAGRLRHDLNPGDNSTMNPGPNDAIRFYREIAELYERKPEEAEGGTLNEIA